MRNILTIYILILVLSVSIFAQNETTSCPTIQMTSPAGITTPGETMTFSVKVEDEKDISKLKYEWTVSAGTIIEGQYTSAIRLATTTAMGDSTVTVKVTILGLPANCSNEAVETVVIAPTIVCGLMDDYGKVSSAMEKSMLDGLFMTLLNEPEHTVFFLLTIDKGETVRQTKSRIIRIIKYAKYRGINKNRFVFAIDKSKADYYLTTAYFISQNKEFPECENCEIIRGEDVK